MIGPRKGSTKGRPKGSKNKSKSLKTIKPTIVKLPDDEQKKLVKEKLTEELGSISLAAQSLQMPYNTLYAYIQREPDVKEYLEDLQRSNWEKTDKSIKRKSIDGDKDFVKYVLQYQRAMGTLGYSKEPDIQINNQISFRFEMDDFEQNNEVDEQND